jgi:hypothetical protein
VGFFFRGTSLQLVLVHMHHGHTCRLPTVCGSSFCWLSYQGVHVIQQRSGLTTVTIATVKTRAESFGSLGDRG